MIVGEWARELGAKVEGRQVSSAKSWLSHQAVDRSSDILPWAGAQDVDKVSPVIASASYLNHIRQAWNYRHPSNKLEDQDVVVTVPASFDETARKLTLEAAQLAGLKKSSCSKSHKPYVTTGTHATSKPQLMSSKSYR